MDLGFVADVDGFGDDGSVGEFLVQGFHGGEGLVRVEVPEGEAAGAVLEEGGGGFEGEGPGAAGYWGGVREGFDFVMGEMGKMYTDCVALDRESILCPLRRREAIWWWFRSCEWVVCG